MPALAANSGSGAAFLRRTAIGACGVVVALACAVLGTVLARAEEGQRADLVDRKALRVCSDPANLPFSNDKGEGFENKIAEIVAADLKVPVEYVWFPDAMGFIRNTLFAKRCDVVMGRAQGDELVLSTNAYYRTAYALVYRKGAGLDGADSLADPRLKDKRIGVIAGTPPSSTMAQLGLMPRAKPYPLLADRRYFKSSAELMIADIRGGAVDAGVLWGPLAGFYAARGGEKLTVVPLLKETVGPRMAYRITFGVRPTEDEWKRQLNTLIAKLQGKFDTVLLQYGVPLLDEQDHVITAPRP
jgi:quinoprotein dehydrogenase-associated probable ABC transporter substrate-binding protein